MRYLVVCPVCGEKESIEIIIVQRTSFQNDSTLWITAETGAGGIEHHCTLLSGRIDRNNEAVGAGEGEKKC